MQTSKLSDSGDPSWRRERMSNPMQGFEPLLQGIAVPLVLGIAATFTRLCRLGWHSWTQFFSSCAVSCFVSVLAFWGLDYLDLAPTVDAAIIGFSAYMGGSLLDILVFKVRNTIEHAPIHKHHHEEVE